MKGLEVDCRQEERRLRTRESKLNGLDYVEVDYIKEGERYRCFLRVYFLGKAPKEFTEKTVRNYLPNVVIEGGRRIRNVRATDLKLHAFPKDPRRDDYLTVEVDPVGDFSTYTLWLVEVDKHHQPLVVPGKSGCKIYRPFHGFDPRYARVEFSFKAGCPSELDCLPQQCVNKPLKEPEINYLAKDYSSFKQLMLDRLSLIMPAWQERHVPDLGITLVELLAYVGDHLSYYQDAVATEAYLATARQRISVRRHARLVDYRIHEGCNARSWVCVEVADDFSGERSLEPKELYFATAAEGNPAPIEVSSPGSQSSATLISSDDEVFEPIQERRIELFKAHNEIHFYTWGDRECCLPHGATEATLLDGWIYEGEAVLEAHQPPESQAERKSKREKFDRAKLRRELNLHAGDVLIFEEMIGPNTGRWEDADPGRRHAVRLIEVQANEDPVLTLKLEIKGQSQNLPTPVVEIKWAIEDALPFSLCLSTITERECQYIEKASVARGNVILVDHGRTVDPSEPIGSVPVKEEREPCLCEGRPSNVAQVPGRFEARLSKTPISFREPLPADDLLNHDFIAATTLIKQDPSKAEPHASLLVAASSLEGKGETWDVRPDLLASGPDDPHFVVEINDEGEAQLRFGDGELGKRPQAGMSFLATYRVGNGSRGNVGAEAISRAASRTGLLSGISRVRNPLPAKGGTDAEPMAEVKLFAPAEFRKRLERAIIADDYAQLVQREFSQVQSAFAQLVWTGSWYEAEVAVDRRDAVEMAPDDPLLQNIDGMLHRYRRIGHDLRVEPANYVPLNIELTVCVLPDYLRGHIKAALLDIFSNRALPDGRLGMFHPDNLTFGEDIYLSKLVAAAQAVPGVQNVTVSRFQRNFEPSNNEIENGVLPLSPTEVARLDNDPSFPENGKLSLVMGGGR